MDTKTIAIVMKLFTKSMRDTTEALKALSAISSTKPSDEGAEPDED